MNWIDKLERKFGRLAVHNLMLYLIIFYAFGYLMLMTNPDFYMRYLSLNAYEILHGQVWRVVTFLIYPPSTNMLWLLLLSYIYYSLGRGLESMWGTFKFNLYMIIGILGTVLSAIIIYLVWGIVWVMTADKLYLTMLLGYAITIPDAQFLLYFIIPVKAKWLGWVYVALEAYAFFVGSGPSRVAIVVSLLNVILFFATIRKPATTLRQAKRRHDFEQKMQQSAPKMQPRHRCAVCGITEKDAPNMEFRFCSRCEGTYEYCMDHLYTHIHVTQNNDN